LFFGDFGLINDGHSFKQFLSEVQSKKVHLILHVGDWAYDLDSNNGTIGDEFLDKIQPLTSALPYMGCLGNHEMKWNGTHWNERFQIYNVLGKNSGSGNNNWWFSWEYMSGNSLVHMTSISTEVYYQYIDPIYAPLNYTLQRYQQYHWLLQDLEDAKKRGADWLIVYGHRPMYCSQLDDFPACSTDAQTLREGWNGTHPGLEEVLVKYGVDLYLSGHQHCYERTFPVYNGEPDYQDPHMYINPKYPVYIISGAAGNQENQDYTDDVFYGRWSVTRSSTYGFGHVTVYNSTHLYWDEYLDEGRAGIDTLWIIKDPSIKKNK